VSQTDSSIVFVGARRSSPGMREVRFWEEKEDGVGPPPPPPEEEPIVPVRGREEDWRGSSKVFRSAGRGREGLVWEEGLGCGREGGTDHRRDLLGRLHRRLLGFGSLGDLLKPS